MFNITIEQVKKEILKNKSITHVGFRCYDKHGRICDAGREEMNRKDAFKFLNMMVEFEDYNECEISKQSESYVIVQYKVA